MLAASYAKINLFLEVLDRLPENYHKVNTVLCSIDLFDEIKYVLTKRESIIVWSSVAELSGENNLIYKIAKYLQDTYKVCAGVEIYLKKRIPIAAGLGGGSSNAASAIEVLNKLWQLQLSQMEKEHIAASFGSDINFFLHGGTANGENRGERITEMSDIIIDNIVLVNPGILISAGAAYGAVEVPLPSEVKLFDPNHPISTMFNRLEPAVRKLYPVVDRLLDQISLHGAVKSMLSGSGSTCFGIFKDAKKAKLCADYFAKLGYFTHHTKTISQREYKGCFPN
ncbi:MAG: 4-(cytidine 5'-diphospho)-2-C-methyl-D-erythritol kinase [Candidatus Cloacimonetes bacterium]|nr:4-(cytidine 5'-diphospho)-2-C-methyl-D-erythritol kinase [Candidatus Cloacimonadota bacterium]